MHEGDTSLDGFDETGASEKSVVRDVSGGPIQSNVRTHMRMKDNQTTQSQERGSLRRSRTVDGCPLPLVPITG